MAHMVETMAYAGELPWHGLGVKVIDDLTPEQLAEISSDDEEQGLLDDDEKKKKKKWYQRVGSAAAGAASGVVGFFTG